MNFSNSNMCSFDTILSGILSNVDDTDMKKFSIGTYKFVVQECLEQLSFSTLMLTLEKDFDMPDTLSLEIPIGCFNIQGIYVFNGSCCSKTESKKLWWKRNYRTKGLTEGYITNVMKNTEDPFITPYSNADEVYFYNAEGGYVYLSPSCANYERVEIVFNGVLTNYGDTPIIPMILRKAVVDYCTHEIFKKLKAKDSKYYRPLTMDAYAELYDRRNGSWQNAVMWCRSLDSDSRRALLEYLSKMNN